METIEVNKKVYVLKRDMDTALTTERKKKQPKGDALTALPFTIGEAYFFRTVTYFATGRVKAICGDFIELEDAACIADTGRFRDAMMTGVLSEVEPVEVSMFINARSITDAFQWTHSLPREQK